MRAERSRRSVKNNGRLHVSKRKTKSIILYYIRYVGIYHGLQCSHIE